jgi:hypothetical protein
MIAEVAATNEVTYVPLHERQIEELGRADPPPIAYREVTTAAAVGVLVQHGAAPQPRHDLAEARSRADDRPRPILITAHRALTEADGRLRLAGPTENVTRTAARGSSRGSRPPPRGGQGRSRYEGGEKG